MNKYINTEIFIKQWRWIELKKEKIGIFYLLTVLIIIAVIISGCDSPDLASSIIESDDVQELSVFNGTSEDDVIDELNSKRNKLNVTLDNGKKVVADVIWEEFNEEYDSEGPGPFTVKGRAKYQSFIKDVTVDVRVLAWFEISDLKVEPETITDETEAVDLSFTVENKSDYDCEQEIVFTIESAGEEESRFDGTVIEITPVELEAGNNEVFIINIDLPDVDDLPFWLNIKDINGDWEVIGSTNNDSTSTQITVNIDTEE